MNPAEYQAAGAKLVSFQEESLRKHGATHMASYSNFIAYIGQEPDGRWFYWVKAWGVDHGKIYGATENEARAKAEAGYA